MQNKKCGWKPNTGGIFSIRNKWINGNEKCVYFDK